MPLMEAIDAPVASFKYWAFISYSHADHAWGDWLHRALETYRLPRRLVGKVGRSGDKVPVRLFPVFRDREELPTSAELGGNLRFALEQSRFLIVICSPGAATSRWVNEEIRTFQRLGRADRILALMVAGEPNAGVGKPGFPVEEECFPSALRFQTDASGELTTIPSEPIAADVRAGKDGRANARLKLIAGIVGVDLDALRQRDRQRQRQRRLWMAAALTALIGIGVGGRGYYQEQSRRRVELVRRAGEAAEARKAGRIALTAGDDIEALRQLDHAAELAPPEATPDPALELMRGAAREWLQGLVRVFPEMPQRINEVEVDPGGRRLFALWGTGTVGVWDVADGQPVARHGTQGDPDATIRNAQFNHDGSKILILNATGTALLDFKMDRYAQPISALGAGNYLETPFHAAWLPDGRRIGGVFPDKGSLRTVIWDAATKKPLTVYKVSVGGESHLIPNSLETHGARAFCRFDDNQMLVWDWETGQPIGKFAVTQFVKNRIDPTGMRLLAEDKMQKNKHPVLVRSAETGETLAILSTSGVVQGYHWSPSGRYILTLDEGHGFAVWELSNTAPPVDTILEPVHHWLKPSRGGQWTTGCVSPDETTLALRDNQGIIELFALPGGESYGGFQDRNGFIGEGGLMAAHPPLVFTPDGEGIFSADNSRQVKLWRWREACGHGFVILPPPHVAVANAHPSANGRLWVASDSTEGAIVRDVATGQLVCRVKNPDPLEYVLDADLSPDGGFLVTAGPRSMIRLWETASGRLVGELHDAVADKDAFSLTLSTRAAYSPIGNRMATAVQNFGAVTLREGTTGRQLVRFKIEDKKNGLGTLQFTPDGTRLLVVAGDKVIVHSATDGAPLGEIATGNTALDGACVSPDGSLILTWTKQRVATVWEWPGGRKRTDLGGVGVREPRFSGDSKEVFAGCGDGTVRTWEVATGHVRRVFKEVKPPEPPDNMNAVIYTNLGAGMSMGGFLCAAISPQGRWIAGGNADGTVCVWDRQSGEQLARFAAGDRFAAVAGVFFSPDGARLTAMRANGTGWTWTLPERAR